MIICCLFFECMQNRFNWQVTNIGKFPNKRGPKLSICEKNLFWNQGLRVMRACKRMVTSVRSVMRIIGDEILTKSLVIRKQCCEAFYTVLKDSEPILYFLLQYLWYIWNEI